MKTGTHFAERCGRAAARGGWILAAILFVGVRTVAAQDLGFADYQNVWYESELTSGAQAATSTLCYNGHVGPVLQAVDPPTTPTDGTSYTLVQSVFGEAVGGRTFFGPDYDIGDEILPPDTVVYTTAPVIHEDSLRTAFYAPSAQKVFGSDMGLVYVDWYTTGGLVEKMYLVSNQPAFPPVRLYHTQRNGGGAGGGPPVDLSNAPSSVTIHYNNTITTDTYCWIDSERRLHARRQAGLVVFEYNEAPLFAGIQIVEVRGYAHDGGATATVGQILTPAMPHANPVATPHVGRGREGDKPYVFQYGDGEAPLTAKAFAVRPTSGPKHDQIDLFWSHTDDWGVAWPYDMRRYTVSWPDVEPAKLYWTEEPARGPTVDLSFLGTAPAPTTATVYYNDAITTVANLWLDGDRSLHARNQTGWVLLRYDEPAGTSDTLEFVDVRGEQCDGYSAVEVGTLLGPTIERPGRLNAPVVGKGLADTLSANPYVYQYGQEKATTIVGQVFAVRPTRDYTRDDEIELFWLHTGAHYNVVWPYEMTRYEAIWPAAADWQRIYHNAGQYPAGHPLVGSMAAGPLVMWDSALIGEFFYNADLPSMESIAIDFTAPDNPVLKARADTGRQGKILLRIDDSTNTGLCDLEFVDVMPYKPDAVLHTNVGDQLKPLRTDFDLASSVPAETQITRGGAELDNKNYAYKHGSGEKYKGAVFCTRPTAQAIKLEIFFKRRGRRDIIWPCEMYRYTAEWPEDAQLFVRGTSENVPGPVATIPEELGAELMLFQEEVGGGSREEVNHAMLERQKFSSNLYDRRDADDYYALLKLGTPKTQPGDDWLGFQVVRCVRRDDTDFWPGKTDHARWPWDDQVDWSIGTEITDAWHATGPLPGFIYHEGKGKNANDKYDPTVYDPTVGGAGYATGQVFPVFPGKLEVWWSNARTYGREGQTTFSVQWPSVVKRYDSDWPDAVTSTIVIASGQGSGQIPAAYLVPEIYYQNDNSQIGYCPNYEHAVLQPYGTGEAAFALRCDLNKAPDSDKLTPYVLLKYRDSTQGNRWGYRVLKVERGVLQYDAVVGTPIMPPYPLSLWGACEKTFSKDDEKFWWKDRNDQIYAIAAGNDGSPTTLIVNFFYKCREGFAFPATEHKTYAVGEEIPWLAWENGVGSEDPVDVEYMAKWPDDIPTLQTGETLVRSKFALPEIENQCSVQILYQSAPASPNAYLIDYYREREVVLDALPTGADAIVTEQGTDGKYYFVDLPPHLRNRVRYNKEAKKLDLVGELVELTQAYYVHLNVLSEDDKTALLSLTPDAAFQTAVNTLAVMGLIKLQGEDVIAAHKALVGHSATNGGYVTLAFNDHEEACAHENVGVHVLRVVDTLYQGLVDVIEPPCCFDERLTLRHIGDFAGQTGRYTFEWQACPTSGSAPWTKYLEPFEKKEGAVQITLGGASKYTLGDHWFRCRYRPTEEQDVDDSYSSWTQFALAEGWIKRVMRGLGGYEQRPGSPESRIAGYGADRVNTIVSMIGQAGRRWEGAVPLSCGPNLDRLGLIEIYETVLNRGMTLSIDASPPIPYEPAYNALLLAAGRIADLYVLLGNEAYADACDPTIAFGTNDGVYGKEACSLHCFMNQTASLLEEELDLLRGRDDSKAPGSRTAPIYNRLIWNFTGDISGGEVAYVLNYDIEDALGNQDGTVDLWDAMMMYPQGHGDAWGHYLTAIKRYYRLLQHPVFDWVPRAEAVNVGDVAVAVDYMDERKFAKVAAAKARTGAEIVNLTYRQAYVENPEAQWQGYKDNNPNRAWGLSEWASRAGQGAYIDWVVANAILPDEDTAHTGIEKVDRTTVAELREIGAALNEIQMRADEADFGLNPLGLAKNVVPFDIDPAQVSEPISEFNKTHFEQIYDRAMIALGNAVRVFDHATNCTQLLRRQADSQKEFENTVADQEADFKNRLIEIFGYPYDGDIGPGKIYPEEYDGPDILRYDYVNASELLGSTGDETEKIVVTLNIYQKKVEEGEHLTWADLMLANPGEEDVVGRMADVEYDVSVDGFGPIIPWRERTAWGERRAPGEIQRIRSDLVQQYGQYKKLLTDYDNLLYQINDLMERIDTRITHASDKLGILEKTRNTIAGLNAGILAAGVVQRSCERASGLLKQTLNAAMEFVPKSTIVGVAVGGDMTFAIRGALTSTASGIAIGLAGTAEVAAATQQGLELAKELERDNATIGLFKKDEELAIKGMVRDLLLLVRQETSFRFELLTQMEATGQTLGEYRAAIARGLRLIDDLQRFRRQTASKVQSYRYKDMGFRVFRNDALQKYRAQFDMAARYVYLAAKAYDYETNLLARDQRAGEHFLTSIVRSRSLGTFEDGEPQTGSGLGDPGLADIMARMKLNWDLALRTQLGFTNPQTETIPFSLREGYFRNERTEIRTNEDGVAESVTIRVPLTDEEWTARLWEHVQPNLFTVREFRRYCRLFYPYQAVEPGIVMEFPSLVNFGFNFFGNKLLPGDSAYDSTNFATKVRSVGVWFGNYEAATTATEGMSRTPRVYLIPVGNDIMRSPTGTTGETRGWMILDQKLPVPFPIGPVQLQDPEWIPMIDTLGEEFAAIRRYSSFRAYHDSGFDESQMTMDSRLVGRSVWNTRWLLIIPAGTLHENRNVGLENFINNVTDIKIFFQTYAYSGN